MVLEPQPVADTVDIPGRLDPWQSAILAAEQEGRVFDILVEQGDVVKKGQALLELDSRLWQEAEKKADLAIQETEKDWARWTELKKTGAVSVNDYEDIETAKDRAVIALNEARVMVSQCRVASPFDGVINARLIEEGEYANKGAAVLQVVDTGRIKLKLNVPERDIMRIQPGQAVPFAVPAYPGVVFTGEVTFVAAVASPDSNTFALEARVDNTDGRLKGGMIAQVTLTRGVREQALTVPLAAIVPKKGEHVVFLVKDQRAERRVVQIDALVGADAVVVGGLQAGDEIVIEGQRTLQDGALLDVRRDATTALETEK